MSTVFAKTEQQLKTIQANHKWGLSFKIKDGNYSPMLTADEKIVVDFDEVSDDTWAILELDGFACEVNYWYDDSPDREKGMQHGIAIYAIHEEEEQDYTTYVRLITIED